MCVCVCVCVCSFGGGGGGKGGLCMGKGANCKQAHAQSYLSLGFHLSISGLIESVYRAAKVLTDQQAALSSRSMFA